MRIGIIGTGIAGLSAAWIFNRAGHQVTLYEKNKTLGMDAHSMTFVQNGASLRTDVPPRIFNAAQWPNVLNLYRKAGVAFESIDPSQSFSVVGQPNFLNMNVANQPQLPEGSENSIPSTQIMSDITRLIVDASQDLAKGLSSQLTLADYLRSNAYSQAFIYDYLYPTLASTVCTCSYESIDAYPAPIILKTLLNLAGPHPLLKTRYGTQDVVKRLSQGVNDIRYGTSVSGVSPLLDGVQVETAQGQTDIFDHLIVATQANQALGFLNMLSEAERKMLSAFRYEDVPIFVHRDTSLMPAKRNDWAHINLIISQDRLGAMCSVWMNRFNPDWHIDQSIIQTINPLFAPQADTVIAHYNLQRPVVDLLSLEGLDILDQLHQQADRRIWFCGSYAAQGVPLLESAVISSIGVAHRLSVNVQDMIR